MLMQSGRYLTQTGQHQSARPLFEKALQICNRNESRMRPELVDTLFSFARFGAETNMDPHMVLEFGQRILRIREDMYHQMPSDQFLSNVATAHTGIAQAYLLLDRYSEAIKHAEQCILVESTHPDMVAGTAINQFAKIFQAWALAGLGEQWYDEAADTALEVIHFREKMYGKDDTKSPK